MHFKARTDFSPEMHLEHLCGKRAYGAWTLCITFSVPLPSFLNSRAIISLLAPSTLVLVPGRLRRLRCVCKAHNPQWQVPGACSGPSLPLTSDSTVHAEAVLPSLGILFARVQSFCHQGQVSVTMCHHTCRFDENYSSEPRCLSQVVEGSLLSPAP